MYLILKAFSERFKSLRCILEFKIESLELNRLFPIKKLFDFMVLNVVCLEVKV